MARRSTVLTVSYELYSLISKQDACLWILCWQGQIRDQQLIIKNVLFSQPQITDKNKKLTNKIKFLWLLLSSKPRGVCGNMKLRFFSLTTCHLLLVGNISWTPKLVAWWRQALIYAILHKLQFLSSRFLGNAHFLCSLKTDA